MQNLGDFRIDDYVTFGVQLHRFSSGAVYAPTGSVSYTFYENNSTSGAPTGGNLAQLNSKTGLYTARVQLTTASGFEAGKEYFIHVEATVDSVAAAELFRFRIIDVPTVDVTKWNGTAVASPNTAGYPVVTVKDGTGTGEIDTSSGKVSIVSADITSIQNGLSTLDAAGVRTAVGLASANLDTQLSGINSKTTNLPAAPASTTNITAGTITTVTTLTNDPTGVTTLLSRLSSTRAGYLDNLSAGAVALEASLQGLITTVSGLAAAAATAVWAAGTRTLSAFGFTVTTSDSSNVAAIKTVTDAIGATGAGLSAIPWNPTWDAEVQSECADAITAANVSTLTAAQVNAEVVDALATDTYAEPGQGTPGATISLAAKINYLYKFLRNKKTQTATTKEIYNDDAATVDHKCTVSDDGTTYTETEITSGP